MGSKVWKEKESFFLAYLLARIVPIPQVYLDYPPNLRRFHKMFTYPT